MNVEHFFTGMLVACSAAIGWFAVYVLYKLFKGQS